MIEHPALFMTPRDDHEQGMELAGARSHRVIAYSEAFLMQTRPTTRTGKAKIYRGRGITINGLQYWHERMMASDVAGQTVLVRFEPHDMGVAYAPTSTVNGLNALSMPMRRCMGALKLMIT